VTSKYELQPSILNCPETHRLPDDIFASSMYHWHRARQRVFSSKTFIASPMPGFK
jgi:hypothetical protein